MCEIDWDILHKYVDSLVWPILVLGLFLLFRNQITKLINRITNESEQIELGGLIKAQFKQVGQLREDVKTGKATGEQTDKVISATVTVQVEGIKLLGQDYIHSNYDQRRILESRISDYSIGLETGDIQDLLDSKDTGHRIGGAIALEHILYRTKTDPAENAKVKQFIIESLADSNSFLRYETLQLVFQSSKLLTELKTKLEEMKNFDKNPAIKTLLKMYVK
ncbi:hypothetical protein MARINOS108_20794 [Marinoscillum sp. 108]|nr:hypothetical protein MARINOS108_20794 [Marinoscillum sp. 108]